MALYLELPISLNVLDAAILEALPLEEEGYRREQIAGGLVVYEIRNWVLRVDAERSEALGREMKHWVYEGKAGELRLRELDSGKTEIVWKGIHTFSHRLTSEGQVWEKGNRQEWEQKDKHLRSVLLGLLRHLEHDEALKRALGAERIFYEVPILQNWEMLYNDYVSVRLPTALEEQQAAVSAAQAEEQAGSSAVAEQTMPVKDSAGDIVPDELIIGGKYGTCRDLTIDDVRAIVARCRAFQAKGGKVPGFYDQLNIEPGTPRSFELETLRGWLNDPKFAPQEDT